MVGVHEAYINFLLGFIWFADALIVPVIDSTSTLCCVCKPTKGEREAGGRERGRRKEREGGGLSKNGRGAGGLRRMGEGRKGRRGLNGGDRRADTNLPSESKSSHEIRA